MRLGVGLALTACLCFWQLWDRWLFSRVELERYSAWLRAAFMVLTVFFFRENYIWQLPYFTLSGLPLLLVLLVWMAVWALRCPALRRGAENRLQFAVLDPVLDNLSFFGLLLPMLQQFPVLGNVSTMAGLLVVTPGLFVVACLHTALLMQSTRWKGRSVLALLYGLLGGIALGSLALLTGSAWPGAVVCVATRCAALAWQQYKERQ